MAKDVGGFLFSSAASNGLALVSSIFVIRTLGPELRGYHAFLVLLGFFLIPFLSFGLNKGAAFFVSSKEYNVKDILTTVFFLAGLIGILAFLISFFLWGFNLLGKTGNKLPIWFIIPVIATYPFNIIKQFLYDLLLADSKYWIANKLGIAFALVVPIFLFFTVVVLNMGMIGIVLGTCLANLTLFSITLFVMIKVYGLTSISWAIDWGYIQKSWTYGKHAWIGTLAAQSNNRSDQMILSYFLTPTDLGLYSICSQFSVIVWFLPSAYRQILFNKISNRSLKFNKRIYIWRYHIRLILVGSIVGIICILFASKIVDILYGSDFIDIVPVLRLYIFGSIIYIGAMILSKYFAGIGRIKINRNNQLLSASLGIVTSFLLIPYLGLWGAAISSCVTFLVSYLSFVFSFKQEQSQ